MKLKDDETRTLSHHSICINEKIHQLTTRKKKRELLNMEFAISELKFGYSNSAQWFVNHSKRVLKNGKNKRKF